jgi:hypothetical protein
VREITINLRLARLECRRCGETLGFAMSLTLPEFDAFAQAFRAAHQTCKRKEVA